MRLDERHLFALEHRIDAADQRALIARVRRVGTPSRGFDDHPSGPSWLWLGIAEPDPRSIPPAGLRWLTGQTDPMRNLSRWGFFARLDPAIEWIWNEGEPAEIVRRVLEPVLPLYQQMTKVGVSLQIPGRSIGAHRDLVPGNRYRLETRYHWRPGPRRLVYEGEPWLTAVRPIASCNHAENLFLSLRIPLSERPGDGGRPYVQIGRIRHLYRVDDRLFFLNEAETLQGAEPVDFWRGSVLVSGILRPELIDELVKLPVEAAASAELPAGELSAAEAPHAERSSDRPGDLAGEPSRHDETVGLRARATRVADALQAAQRVRVTSIFEELRTVDFRRLSPEDAAEKVVVPLLKEAPSRGWSDIARLVLPSHIPYEQDIRRARTGRDAGMRRVWLSGPHHLCHAILYLIYLYNVDYGAVRASLGSLFALREPHPYPRTLLSYLLRDTLGASRDELIHLERRLNDAAAWAPYLHELFAENRVDRWLAKLTKPIKFYSAFTNTVVGLYDWIAANPKSGMCPPPDADVRYDLGGGHATPYVSDLLGRPFSCLDIASPRLPPDTDLILRRRGAEDNHTGDGSEPMSEAEQEEYIAKLNRTPWIEFDVFSDRFDRSHERYLITSFGFLTSTPIGFASAIPKEARGVNNEALATSAQALTRVMELVAAGKTVHLFTYQRATWRRPALKTCLLSFADGMLGGVTWTRKADAGGEDMPHVRVDAELRAKVVELVDPRTSPYAALLSGGARRGAR